MFRTSDFKKTYYRTGEVAKILHVTNRTILNYDYTGKLKFSRTEGNRRVMMREDLIAYLKSLDLIIDDEADGRRDVIYARVSSHDQKNHGDLDRQALYLIENVSDLKNPLILKEVGSGLNDRRPKLNELISMVCADQVGRIFVTYRDRLTRFGYHYLETVCSAHHAQIIVLQDRQQSKSVQDELVEDMMSLIACFSGKLYGMRSGRNRKKKEKKGKKIKKISLRQIGV